MRHTRTPKVIVIGLDGLDPAYVAESMPSFRSKTDVSFNLLSTFPPDSALAWPVAYTGLGLNELLKTTPFRLNEYKSEESMLERVLADRIIGRTYWDKLGHRNHKVCVLFPYPIKTKYDVNGILVTATANGEISISSSKLAEHIRDSVSEMWNTGEDSGEFGRVKTEPALKNYDHIKQFNSQVSEFRRRTNILFKILNGSTGYDLVYFYTDLLEMQHIFLNDAKYVKYAYSLVENFLLNLISTYDSEYMIIVHGDHGFQRREKYLINIARLSNDIFPKGSLNTRQLARNFGVRFLVPQALCGLHLEDIAIRAFYPRAKKLGLKLTSDYSQTMEASLRIRSDVFYDPSFELRRFCGFYVESEEGFRRLSAVLKPYTERLYVGKCDSRLRACTVPTSNVVFELKDYATFYNEHAPLRMLNPKGRSVPGTHSLKTAFYLHSGPFEVKPLTGRTALMIDTEPTILNLFGLRSKSTVGSPLVELEI